MTSAATPTPPIEPSAESPSWGEALDQLIRKVVEARIREAKLAPTEHNAFEPERWSSPHNAGEAVNRLFMLNARQWHLEDLCCESNDNDLRYGDHKKRIERCFKTKRPELIRALNKHLKQATTRSRVQQLLARHPLLVRAAVHFRHKRYFEQIHNQLRSFSQLQQRRTSTTNDQQFIAEGIDRVIFFNCTHNGDLHLSREFVKHLKANIGASSYAYAHFSAPKVLHDLNGIKYLSLYDLHELIPVEVKDTCNCHVGEPYRLDRTSRTLLINTWIGQQGARYLIRGTSGKRDQVTLEGNVRMYSELAHKLGLPVSLSSNYLTWIPEIDYEVYEIARVKKHFAEASPASMRIFIANGVVRSKQIANFDFSPAILKLAEHHPTIEFYLTSKEPFRQSPPKLPNVIFTEDIIAANGGDLNENSYLSLFCNVIVGRESGPFEFCKVKENLFESSKTFICFSRNRQGAFWYQGPVNARRIRSEETSPKAVERVIANEIKRRTDA